MGFDEESGTQQECKDVGFLWKKVKHTCCKPATQWVILVIKALNSMVLFPLAQTEQSRVSKSHRFLAPTNRIGCSGHRRQQ